MYKARTRKLAVDMATIMLEQQLKTEKLPNLTIKDTDITCDCDKKTKGVIVMTRSMFSNWAIKTVTICNKCCPEDNSEQNTCISE